MSNNKIVAIATTILKEENAHYARILREMEGAAALEAAEAVIRLYIEKEERESAHPFSIFNEKEMFDNELLFGNEEKGVEPSFHFEDQSVTL